jgi:hypothetical protein
MVSVRKKARDKQKQDAIKDASSAMFGSVGFFLNIKSEVNSIEEGSLELKQSAGELSDLLVNYLSEEEPPPPPDAVPEDRMPEIAATARKQAFDLAKLGLILPFLINKESREYLANFISGLIGEEALGTIKTTLIGLTAVLTGVFAYKLFKQIGTTIEAVKELSRVTSVLFGITDAANDDLVEEKGKLDKDKKEVEKEKKKKAKEKKVIDEKRRNAVGARDDIKKEKQALKGKGKLSKLFAFASRIAPNVGKKLLTAIPFVGAFAAIGLLLYEIYDEAVNFFDDEDRTPPKVDAVKEEDEDGESVPVADGVQAQAIEKAPIAAAVPPLVKEASKTASDQVPAPSQQSQGYTTSTSSQPTAVPAPAMEITSVDTNERADGKSDGATDGALELPAFTMPRTLDIAESSEEIVVEKKDVVPTIIVNNIDNSTTIAQTERLSAPSDASYRYSTTVGV